MRYVDEKQNGFRDYVTSVKKSAHFSTHKQNSIHCCCHDT